MSSKVVSARALEKRFGAVTALRGIDFDLPRGTAAAILGPNGAGKSTLLRIVAGLSLPTAGTLSVRTDEVGASKSDRAKTRARVGFVGHATLLTGELTARENLLFAARLYGVADAGARADALLAEEGLAEFADRRAGAFSRGMAQRLSIARALVHDPQLLLLDEPFTGLDPASAVRLAKRMRKLVDAGRSLLVTTHDLQRVAAWADSATLLVRGRVAGHASGDELAPAALEAQVSRALGAVS